MRNADSPPSFKTSRKRGAPDPAEIGGPLLRKLVVSTMVCAALLSAFW
jgi:hypothetical protein